MIRPATFGLICGILLITSSSVYGGFPKDCGQRKINHLQLILNGEPAKVGNWPWHTAIFHREGNTFQYQCGGTILDKNTILTAAHCVRLPTGIIASERLSVQVGRNRLHVADDRAQEHEAERILVHQRYTTASVEHDIALIKLATDLRFTDYVQPVCMWNKGDDRLLLRDQEGTIVGFGATSKSKFSEILNEARLPVVDNQICIESNRQVFGQKLTSNMFCAGRRDGVNACNGDSGGGMFFLSGDRWYVRGIVSFTPSSDGRCDPLEYVAFTDVAKYISWIAQQLNASYVEPVSAVEEHPKLRLLSQDICGVNPYFDSKEQDKPVFLTYPWVGLIEYSQDGVREKKTLCHAILISPKYLVTAAQCLYNTKNNRPTSVRLGDYDTSSSQDCDQIYGQRVCSPATQTLNIETIVIHQQYNKPRFANDIALIRVRQTVDISEDNVKPICLPFTKTLKSYKPSHFTRTGWKYSKSQTQMQRSEVVVMESVQCQRLYTEHRVPLEKTFRQICVERDANASAGGKCVFDVSSAPLQAVQTVNGHPRYVLHGLLSFGPTSCQLNYPDVYTNVGTYLRWILDNVQE